jgi:hypothetical protein
MSMLYQTTKSPVPSSSGLLIVGTELKVAFSFSRHVLLYFAQKLRIV